MTTCRGRQRSVKRGYYHVSTALGALPMTTGRRKKPAYLLHKPTGQARVRLNGKDVYLGTYGLAESRERRRLSLAA